MEYLVYILKTALILAVFYTCWRLILRHETCHRANRIILLTIAIVSFLLPISLIHINSGGITNKTNNLISEFLVNASQARIMNDFQVAEISGDAGKASALLYVIMAVYLTGVASILVWYSLSVLRIIVIKRRSRSILMQDGTGVVVTDLAAIPFSWMKWVFISSEDWQRQDSSIILHEKAHLSLGHSYDVLFIGAVSALQWFNPAIWLLRKDLLLVHEYEADDMVLQSGVEPHAYQSLILGRAIGRDHYAVANGFNHSAIKTRINMMLKSKSSNRVIGRAMAFIPLIMVCLILSAKIDDRSVVEFERNYISNLASEVRSDNALRLVGFSTMSYHDQDSVFVNELWRQYQHEIEKGGNIYTAQGEFRLYYSLANAILSCNGVQYIADGNGIVDGLTIRKKDRVWLMGRVATASSRYTQFEEPIAITSLYKKYNTVIFDLGEINH